MAEVCVPMVTTRDSSKAILEENQTAADGSSIVFTASALHKTQIGEVQVWSNGTVLFSPLEVSSSPPSACFCMPTPLPHFPGSDVIGASAAEGSRELVIYHCPPRNAGAAKLTRALKASSPFMFDDAALAQNACAAVRAAAVSLGRGAAPYEAAPAPAALKVLGIVNPVSGSGRSAAAAKAAKETLAHAGVALTVLETARAGDAVALVRDNLSPEFAAVAVFGGDGTVHEVLQGLMASDEFSALLDVPICHVPSGSGNGLAASCGLWSADTALHALVKGASERLDAATLVQPAQRTRLLIFLQVTFGLISSIDIGTEPLRKLLGKERFTYGALKEIAANNKHEVRLAWVPEGELQGVLQRCSPPGASSGAAPGPVAQLGRGPPTPILDELGAAPPALADPSSWPAGWSHLHADPVAIVVMSGTKFAAMDFKLNPNGHQSDGLWEITLDKGLSRGQGLDLLLKAADGKHHDAPYLDITRVGAFALHPVSPGSWVVADGEVVGYDATFVEVHKALLKVVVAPSSRN